MKKFLKSIAVMSLSLLLFNICIQPMSAKAADDELSEAAVAAPSAILVERTSGAVLYEKNAHEKLKPASVTKIMSMLLIMEAIEDGSLTVEDKVTASEHAASMGGSQIYLEPGDQMTVAVGMVLACLVQWEALRGKAVYRVLLILPYAVPSFISILIFKGLFNQSFGEINMMLSALFGVKPAWFSDPTTARTMLIIVNTWLGYPYMMILCMGLLKAIPDDLYEASAMDGAGPFQNFFKITLPLLIKPLTPLMIASFAFNFNNFVLIQLLTNGGPDRLGTTTPAGYTDLLVNYTYRIAFEGGGGQDFGLAAAIATLIFLLVGALAIVNLKATRMKFD